MKNFTFLAVCARALLVFLLPCACSMFFDVGQSGENSSRRGLIVLVLSCCGNGSECGARTTPVEDRRPGAVIWLSPGVVPPPAPAVALEEKLNGCICFGSATRTCGGSHVLCSWRSPSGSEVEVDVAEAGAPEGRKVARSVLRKAKQFLIL